MRFKMRAGLWTSIVLLLSLTGILVPRAEAGSFCAGERDRVLNFFQRTGYLLKAEADRVQDRAKGLLLGPVRLFGPRIALWVLKLQARQALIDALTLREGIEDRLASLNPIWDKTRQVATLAYGEAPPASPGPFGGFTPAVEWAVRTYAICQGIRSSSEEACRLLSPLGDQQESQCRDWVESADWRERCRPPAVYWFLERLIYEIRRTCAGSPSEIKPLCPLFSSHRPCDQQVCESLAQGSDAPCRKQFEEGPLRRRCLDEFAIVSLYQGRMGDAEFARRTKNSPIMDAVQWARPGGPDCLVLALRRFDALLPAEFALGERE